MIAKVLLLCAAVAAIDATWLGPGLIAPGYLNAGLVGPAAVKTSSVVAIPGAVTSDKRVIGAGMLAGAPLMAPGIIGNGLIGNGLIANGLYANGLWGAAPLGVLSPLGLKGAGILAAPGMAKVIG